MMSREPAEVQEALQTVSQAQRAQDLHVVEGLAALMMWRCGARFGKRRSIWFVASIIWIGWSALRIDKDHGSKAILSRHGCRRRWWQGEASKRTPRSNRSRVEVAACPVWFVEVRIVGVDQDPWLLLTDWPVTDEQSATRMFTMYR